MLLKNELFRILGDAFIGALMCCKEERGEGVYWAD